MMAHTHGAVPSCSQHAWRPAAAPRYVERELRGYLECGILAHGFARARCEDCAANFLVAFSCKGRVVFPSCTTKGMAATAAHLVDAVIPRVPMRQWLLSLPKRLRLTLRADAALTTRMLRTFIDAIEQALRADSRVPAANASLGAISFVLRFSAALKVRQRVLAA